MLDTVAAIPAVWGLFGAFVFAGQNLCVCIFECKNTGNPLLRCWMEFLVALLVGIIAASAFTSSAQEWLGIVGEGHMRAVATMIGLVANVAAPVIVKTTPDALAKRINKVIGGDGK